MLISRPMSLDGLIDVRRTAVSKKATISSISVNLGIDERCPNLVWMNVSKSSCSVVLASFGGYYIYLISGPDYSLASYLVELGSHLRFEFLVVYFLG